MNHHPALGYERIRMQTISGREVEASVLEKAATRFRRAQKKLLPGRLDPDTDEALSFNKKIWEVLRADWQSTDCSLPKDLRENLLSLSIFVTKRTLEFRADPRPELLDVLVQINEALVKGLRSRPEQPANTGTLATTQA